MNTSSPSFSEILEHLRGAEPLRQQWLLHFSDIRAEELQKLHAMWADLPLSRKEDLLAELSALAAENTLLSYDNLARSLLSDHDASIRAAAIRLLDECEDAELAPQFIRLLEKDPEQQPRAAAATALGLFVLQGELDEIPAALLRKVEDALLRAANNNAQPDLQRRALESLGYSARLEVPALLEAAYWHENPHWTASAVLGMGRSGDERWEEEVLRALGHDHNAVRLAAAQAAGELEMKNARTLLLRMLEEEEDEDVFNAVIWSLSQIGGEDVRTYLEYILDNLAEEDEAQSEYLEDALENLNFTEDFQQFDLFAFDPEEPPEAKG